MKDGAAGGLAFFTINGNGNKNPRGALCLPALLRITGVVEVLELSSDSRMDLVDEVATRARVVVAVFDLQYGVNYWSPRVVSGKDVPRWVSQSPARWGVGIGRRAVVEGHDMIRSSIAGQIVTMFHHSNGHETPWVTTVHPRTRESRRGERVPRFERHRVPGLW